jgi:nondiscriminating glutamyl-tRNA synthetase
MTKEVRVRIAPSPTGYLHIGTARTALFNWLFAQHNGGKFILRIEDTDLERSEKKFEDDILKGLEWLGLNWDEFYKQSDRTKIYSKYIQKLLDDGKAFHCYHSEEELEKERQEQIAGRGVLAHFCEYKNKPVEHAQTGIIRLSVDRDSKRRIKFNDIIRGEIEFEERLLGDISIAKDTNTPLYNIAVVVDDYEMDITHVIRGEDHIANTPKQILLQEALGFERPEYAHLPLILGPDRSKLSKRHAVTSLAEYRDTGYLPEALLNFLALLGWTSDDSEKEILTKDKIVKQFSLDKVHKSGAVFDIKKLNWINSQYIKTYDDAELAELTAPFVEKNFGKQEKDYLIKISPLFRERLEYLDQVKEFHFFFREPEYDGGLLHWKDAGDEETKNSLAETEKIIEKIGVEDKEKLRGELDQLGKRLTGRGLVYWPLRVALTGEKASPDPVDVTCILGKEKTLGRVKRAVEKLRLS